METIIVDCSQVQDEPDFWREYVRAIPPEGTEYFGRNLDAFWDAVSGGGPGYPGECLLRFIHSDRLKTLKRDRFEKGYLWKGLSSIQQKLNQLAGSGTRISLE